MHQITVYGASDDLVEVEGDVSEEFNHYDEEPAHLAASDGSLLKILYDQSGMWRIDVLKIGEGTTVEHHKGTDEDTDYSDRVTLKNARPFEFVTFGKGKRRR